MVLENVRVLMPVAFFENYRGSYDHVKTRRVQSVIETADIAAAAGVKSEFFGLVNTAMGTNFTSKEKAEDALEKLDNSPKGVFLYPPFGKITVQETRGHIMVTPEGEEWVDRYPSKTWLDGATLVSYLKSGIVIDLGHFAESLRSFEHRPAECEMRDSSAVASLSTRRSGIPKLTHGYVRFSTRQ